MLVNFRLPQSLLDRVREARFVLRKPYVVDLVREALEEYLDRHRIEVPKAEHPKPARGKKR